VAHGPGLLLALLVAALVTNLAGVVTVGLVAVATSVRWGTAWLVPITGAQAVLGPAIAVGPASAAAASAMCGVALVLAGPSSPAAALAVGASAALVVAGPAGAGGVALRLLATVVCTGAVLALGQLGRARLRAVLAVVVAAVALGLAMA
jgi:hypothetical protein